jgi:hypothetical protein
MSNQENDKIIEAAYEKAGERGLGPMIDDGAIVFDLESAYIYLTEGDLP